MGIFDPLTEAIEAIASGVAEAGQAIWKIFLVLSAVGLAFWGLVFLGGLLLHPQDAQANTHNGEKVIVEGVSHDLPWWTDIPQTILLLLIAALIYGGYWVWKHKD